MQTESFNATLAYGRLALACLFAASMGDWLVRDASQFGVMCSILAMGMAYLSQGQYTLAEMIPVEDRATALRYGTVLRWASIGFAFLAGAALL